MVHCMNPVSASGAWHSCWFFNVFLLSLGTCCCPLWFVVLSVSPQGSFFLMVHCVWTLLSPLWPPVPVFINRFLLSPLEHAAVPIWFMGLSIFPQGSFCLMVHVSAPWCPTFLCRGSMTFWGGSGSAVPCLLLMDPDLDSDPDPDPGSGSCYFRHWPLRCQQKTNFLTQFFLLITFWSYIYIIFQRQKVKKSH